VRAKDPCISPVARRALKWSAWSDSSPYIVKYPEALCGQHTQTWKQKIKSWNAGLRSHPSRVSILFSLRHQGITHTCVITRGPRAWRSHACNDT
jgi:hypothetical protein